MSECLNPIKITNPSKFVSLSFGDRFDNFVRCGKCANCQDTLQKEWYYRSFYEYLDTIRDNGYMLMDCLTYSPKFVPRLSRFFRVPKYLNFYCFDYSDIRYFFVRLRTYLSKRGYDVDEKLRYFAAAEYGTDERKTHRPHIHILFYCKVPDLDNYTLSKAVSACWKYGRTDGLPFKSRVYVDNYTIRGGLVSSQRACKYVSKYVMKSSEYQKVLDKRLSAVMHWYYDNRFNCRYRLGKYKFEVDYYYRELVIEYDWNSYWNFACSEFGKKLYRDLRKKINQFHLQSLGFGASALGDIDINELIESNILSIPDSSKIVMRIGLPMYYKRKLFYDRIKIDDRWFWQYNELGLKYAAKRKSDLLRSLELKYKAVELNTGILIPDKSALADYVVNKRGRIDAPFMNDSLITDRLEAPALLYNYSTPSDKAHFHCRFLSWSYLGQVGNYNNGVLYDPIDLNEFRACHVIYNSFFEGFLSQIEEKEISFNQAKQRNYDNKQHLNQVWKLILSS